MHTGEAGLEPATDGFEDHYSTNWAILPFSRLKTLIF